MTKQPPPTQPTVSRGDPVIVTEENTRPWTGVATSMKFSAVSGWWIDVRTDDGITHQVASACVSLDVSAGSEGGGAEQTSP